MYSKYKVYNIKPIYFIPFITLVLFIKSISGINLNLLLGTFKFNFINNANQEITFLCKFQGVSHLQQSAYGPKLNAISYEGLKI